MKYEGFKVSKRVENKAMEIEKEYPISKIMNHQFELERHNKSLGNFMVNNIDIDWNLNPCHVALYNILKATMVQDQNGYWIDR